MNQFYKLKPVFSLIKNALLNIRSARKKWKKVGPVGIEPTTKRLCIPLQFSLPLSGLWAGLSLHLAARHFGGPSFRRNAEGACRPVSTPSPRLHRCRPGLGSGLPRRKKDCLAAQASPSLTGNHLPVSRQAAPWRAGISGICTGLGLPERSRPL